MTQPPRIVRETGVVTECAYSPAYAAEIEQAVETRARAVAERLGIQRPHVTRSWDLHTVCGFAEYPMYLTGPNAPRLETAADVLCHWPAARFTVTIRDLDHA